VADYAIGYRKPPKGKPFKPGKSGNPAGRPKFTPDRVGETAQRVMDAPMQYRQNGRTKTATTREVELKLLAERAANGDVDAADLFLKKRKHALRHGEKSALRLVVTDWLPDYPGQTADQKARDLMGQLAGPAQNLGNHEQEGGDQNRIADNKPLPDEGG